jgi:hypothetical protein
MRPVIATGILRPVHSAVRVAWQALVPAVEGFHPLTSEVSSVKGEWLNLTQQWTWDDRNIRNTCLVTLMGSCVLADDCPGEMECK